MTYTKAKLEQLPFSSPLLSLEDDWNLLDEEDSILLEDDEDSVIDGWEC